MLKGIEGICEDGQLHIQMHHPRNQNDGINTVTFLGTENTLSETKRYSNIRTNAF